MKEGELKSCPFCGGKAMALCVVEGKNIAANTMCGNADCVIGLIEINRTGWNTRHNEKGEESGKT